MHEPWRSVDVWKLRAMDGTGGILTLAISISGIKSFCLGDLTSLFSEESSLDIIAFSRVS